MSRGASPGRSAAVLLVAVLAAVSGAAQQPAQRLLDRPLAFNGPVQGAADPAALGEIRIGLFAPDGAHDRVAEALASGATLAIEEANAAGGLGGTPFRLVRRWAANPWGAGSREVVRLVYTDRVWAVIGATDGAASHVAEQVVTKAFVPMVAPLSGDASLTRAGVPWIFRLAPGDDAQAGRLAAAIADRGLRRPAMVTATDHDSRTMAAALTTALTRVGRPAILHLQVDPRLPDAAATARRLLAARPDAVVLRLPAEGAVALAHALSEGGLAVPMLVPWVPGLEATELAAAAGAPVLAVQPSRPTVAFTRDYRRRWRVTPSFAAAYGYDAVRLVVSGLRAGGLSRGALRARLAAASGVAGASGVITWDAGGGNLAPPVLVAAQPNEPADYPTPPR